MLGDDVFVVLDVAGEAQRNAAQGRSTITLHEGLLRYATESGDNELDVAWYRAPADAPRRLEALTRDLAALGFMSCKESA